MSVAGRRAKASGAPSKNSLKRGEGKVSLTHIHTPMATYLTKTSHRSHTHLIGTFFLYVDEINIMKICL